MKLNHKTMMILGGVFLVLFILSGYWLLVGRKTVSNQNQDVVPFETIAPTIDSSVKVDLKQEKKGEVLLSINNPPNGTSSIEFELSYLVVNVDTGEGESGSVAQGAIGKCYESNSVWECGEPSQSGRKIILGTCSSGVCRYHNITGPIKVSLKFSGSYGNKSFTKEYTL